MTDETGWRDIKTAPKDFTPIIAFIPGATFGGIQEEFDEVAVVFWKGNGWRYQHDDHLWAEPTHWLPIPPTPKEEGMMAKTGT